MVLEPSPGPPRPPRPPPTSSPFLGAQERVALRRLQWQSPSLACLHRGKNRGWLSMRKGRGKGDGAALRPRSE